MRFDSKEFGSSGRCPLSVDNASIVVGVLDILDRAQVFSGCLVGGSRAAGVEAEKSDVDLFVLCASGTEDRKIEECLAQMCGIPCVYGMIAQGRFPWFGNCFTLFAQSFEFSIDVGFITEEVAPTFFWEPTGIILWDDSKLIEDGVAYWRSRAETNPFRISNPLSQGCMAIYKGLKSIEKKELFNAIELCGQARRALIVLLRKRIGGAANLYYGRAERRVEQVLSQELLLRLGRTHPQYSLDSAEACLRELAVWLLELGRECRQQSDNERRSFDLLVELLRKY